MKKPDFVIDIFLQPGEFYFGDAETRVRTLLGSCVSITMWHPHLLIGGMCHYMLPGNHRKRDQDELDGRYAEDVMIMFLDEIKKTNTQPREYEIKVFGAGNMFAEHGVNNTALSVSDKNIDIGRTLLQQYGFKIKAEHLGGEGHRNIIFDIWSGDVWMRHVSRD
jgi:chemotaxis protein CheD